MMMLQNGLEMTLRKSKKQGKKAAASRTVSSGRGTGSRKLGDMPESKKTPDTKGMTRSTGRGTGSRKSRGQVKESATIFH